eukprot:271302-Hanusia_phi.AAC.1
MPNRKKIRQRRPPSASYLVRGHLELPRSLPDDPPRSRVNSAFQDLGTIRESIQDTNGSARGGDNKPLNAQDAERPEQVARDEPVHEVPGEQRPRPRSNPPPPPPPPPPLRPCFVYLASPSSSPPFSSHASSSSPSSPFFSSPCDVITTSKRLSERARVLSLKSHETVPESELDWNRSLKSPRRHLRQGSPQENGGTCVKWSAVQCEQGMPGANHLDEDEFEENHHDAAVMKSDGQPNSYSYDPVQWQNAWQER